MQLQAFVKQNGKMGRPRDKNGRFYTLSKLNRGKKTKSVLKRINEKGNAVKHSESKVKIIMKQKYR